LYVIDIPYHNFIKQLYTVEFREADFTVKLILHLPVTIPQVYQTLVLVYQEKRT